MQLLIYLTVYLLYNKSKNKQFKLKFISFNRKLYIYLDLFLFVYLFSNFLVIFLTNMRAGIAISTYYTFIIRLLPIQFLFVFYYVLNRNNGYRIFFLLNLLIYIFCNLLQGYVGSFLYLFFVELFMRKEKLPAFYLLFIPLSFIPLSLIYMFLFPFKLSLRTGESFDLYKIGFTEAFLLLIGRISLLANSFVIIQHIKDILSLINFLPDYFSLLRAIRVIIPGWLAKDIFPEEIVYYGYAYLLWIFHTGLPITFITDEGKAISYGIGLIGITYLLVKKSWIEFFFYVLVVIFLIFLIKLFLDLFKYKKLYFPFWLLLLYFINESASLETLSWFTFGLFNFLFLIIFLSSLSKIKSGGGYNERKSCIDYRN